MEFEGGTIVLHMDMDAFYASVEMRDDPSLRGKPLIIGALPNERGVVATCSYEARSYGVRSAMSIKEAYRRCPNGIYMHGHYEKYHEASDIIHHILSEYTDRIRFVALDEGYLDITGSVQLFGGAEAIGHAIKERVYNETALTCSVGIGYNPLSAKTASEEKKPDGFFVLHSCAEFQRLLSNRPVGVLHGVGGKTTERLIHDGIRTVADLMKVPLDILRARYGQSGEMLYRHCRGIDERKIEAEKEDAKSFSKEITFQQDLTSRAPIEDTLRLLARKLSILLLRRGLWCYTLTLKIRYYDLKINTRSVTLASPTHNAFIIYQEAVRLLERTDLTRPIRLVGLSLSHPVREYTEQLSLGEGDPSKLRIEKQEKLNLSLLSLYDKYGSDVVTTAAEKEAREHLPD